MPECCPPCTAAAAGTALVNQQSTWQGLTASSGLVAVSTNSKMEIFSFK
jgi:hypothetical protein